MKQCLKNHEIGIKTASRAIGDYVRSISMSRGNGVEY